MLTSKQRHDRHDIDPRELKLIRVGHALWGHLQERTREIRNGQ
jgi:hypothetical protein